MLIAARVPIEEAGAAFAALTLTGESASEATTKLKRLILALAAPSPEAARALKLLNVELVKFSDADRAIFDEISNQIAVQKNNVRQIKQGTAAYDEQREVLVNLEAQFDLLQRTRGVFVGIPEALKRIKVAGEEAGGE